jgi:DNA-binding transcriptional LysR family regulator
MPRGFSKYRRCVAPGSSHGSAFGNQASSSSRRSRKMGSVLSPRTTRAGWKVEMRALADEPFILRAEYSTPSLYGKVMDICRQAGFAPKAVQKDVGLMQTIIGLVAGEIGVALVPASLRNLNGKGVVYREVQGFTPTVEMSVMWRRDNTRPVLSSFLQVVDDVSKSAQEEALAG